MASYHLCAKIISRGNQSGSGGNRGNSSIASAAYRSASALNDERQGLTFDYSKKDGVIYSEILLPVNAPEFLKDREKLWNAVEAVEKRKDAQLAREIEIALPKELSLDQNKELVRDFAQKNFVDRGMIADINFHYIEKNPHCHIMLSTREITSNGFGKKNREWNKAENIQEWRKEWAEIQNQHLAKAGYDIQVDHRSYADRGINIEPQIHLGPVKNIEAEKAKTLDRLQEFHRIARENGDRISEDPKIALDQLSYHQATFTQQDIWRFANQHSADSGQFQKVRSAIENNFELVRLGKDENDAARFTTQTMLKAEKSMIHDAIDLSNTHTHGVSDKYIEQAIQTRTLSNQQEKAFRKIAQSEDIVCMIGKAGTGKSYTLDAVREAFEAQGYQVRGAALAGIAAESLHDSSKIQSQTIHRTLWEWDKGRNLLSDKNVLVIDEAGMVGTRQAHKIVEHVKEAGAKLVLVGDHDQLQPVEAGGAFRGIFEQVGYLELSEIKRQSIDWQKEATKQLSSNKEQMGKALEAYAVHGNIKSIETFDQAKDQLIQDWAKNYNQDGSSLILAYRNKDVHELNKKARDYLISTGKLRSTNYFNIKGVKETTVEFKTVNGVREFSIGDRIIFLKNENSMKVKNGSLGIVERIEKESLQVKLDNGYRVAFDAKMYEHFDHGYAATVHKTQGTTVDKAFVLGSSHFDKHLTYVALSRHREDVSVYVSKDKNGFIDFEHMKSVLGRERPKDLVIDYAQPRGITVDEGKGHLLSPELLHRKKNLLKGFQREAGRIENLGDYLKKDKGEFELMAKDYQRGISQVDRAQELERFKTGINLSEYAASKGYELDRKESYRNVAVMRSADDKIHITKDKDGHYIYYSWHEHKGGSIIDFHQKLTNENLGETRKALRPWIEEFQRPTKVEEKQYLKDISHTTSDREQIQKIYSNLKPCENHKYLEYGRKIDHDIINDGRFKGKIFIDGRNNAVFPHLDQDGLCGIEKNNKDFKQIEGTKGLWASNAFKSDNKLVICESSIDALSYQELKGDEKTRYVSFAGDMSPKQKELLTAVIERMDKDDAEIIIGTDNDKRGNEFEQEIRELSKGLEHAQLKRAKPDHGKDWNEELKAEKHKESEFREYDEKLNEYQYEKENDLEHER